MTFLINFHVLSSLNKKTKRCICKSSLFVDPNVAKQLMIEIKSLLNIEVVSKFNNYFGLPSQIWEINLIISLKFARILVEFVAAWKDCLISVASKEILVKFINAQATPITAWVFLNLFKVLAMIFMESWWRFPITNSKVYWANWTSFVLLMQNQKGSWIDQCRVV